MASKLAVINPYLNSILFDWCYNLPLEQVRTMSMRYRRMLASEARTKNWCASSSIDEKMIFLAEIGANFGFTIFFDKAKGGVALKQIWEKYEAEKTASAQQDHAKFKVFITTAKETAFFMGLCSQTINNETYLRALDYNKTGFSIRNWKKKLNTPVQDEINEVVANANVVSDTILNSGMVFDVASQVFGINDVEAKLLLYYYRFRQRYISRDTLNMHFKGYIAIQRINRAFKKLQLNGYLTKHIDWRKFECTISPSGVLLSNDIINRVLKQNDF